VRIPTRTIPIRLLFLPFPLFLFFPFFDSIFDFIFDLGGVTNDGKCVCVCVKVGEVGDDAMDAYWRSLPGWM
jgi:hypothetical protein